MNTKIKILILLFIFVLIGFITGKYLKSKSVYKLQEGDIQLDKPTSGNYSSLMEALQKRRSNRKFATTPLNEDLITNILWSADGINSPDGKRTAPSAMNKQEIELYAILPNGAFLYMPKENILKRITPLNMTDKTGFNAPIASLTVL